MTGSRSPLLSADLVTADDTFSPPWRALSRMRVPKQILALADQIVVSATSFLVFVIVARLTGPGELGAYALAMSVLAFCLAAQDSLITRPYTLKLHDVIGSPKQHAGNVLLLTLALCIGCAVAGAAAAITFSASEAHQQFVRLAWALTGAVPFVLLREFARRFAFAHLAVVQALMLDAGAAMLTVAAVGLLYWSGGVSAATMLLSGSAACLVATLIWLFTRRNEFARGFNHFRATLQQCWTLGRWFLWGQISLQVQGYVIPWLALVFGGATTAGLYAACASIIAFTNPVILGLGNILTPKFVRVFRQDGVVALRRQTLSDALLLGGLMAGFCVVIFLFGADIMHLLYSNEIYASNGHVLSILALAALTATAGLPASLAIAATGRARAVASITLFTAVVTTGLVFLLLPRWGLLGAAYAVLLGEMTGATARWTALLLVPAEDAGAESSSHRPQQAKEAACDN